MKRPPSRRRRNVAGAAVAALVAAAVANVTSSFFMSSNVTAEMVNDDEDITRLVVVFRGMQARTITQAAPLINDWAVSGYEILVIDSQDKRYNVDQVASYAASQIRQLMQSHDYDEIVFVGLSMGGVAAADALLLLHQDGGFGQAKTRLVLDEAPSTNRSLRPPNNVLAPLVALVAPRGVITNWLLKPAIKAGSGSLDVSTFEDDADVVAVAAAHTEAQRVPASRWFDELGSFSTYEWFGPGTLSFVDRIVYITSTVQGDVMTEIASREWRCAVGKPIRVIQTGRPHVDIAAHPAKSIKVYEAAFAE